MTQPSLDPKKTMLLMAGVYAGVMDTLPHAKNRHVIENAQAVLLAAREAGILVCHCATVFRPGYVDLNERNKLLGHRKRSGKPPESDPLQLIHPSVKPFSGEVVIGKSRASAFIGSDLELVLRANNIETIVMLGWNTGGVVLATARHASDLDYRVLLVEDCCADSKPEIHDFLFQHLFPRETDIVTSQEVVEALANAKTAP